MGVLWTPEASPVTPTSGGSTTFLYPPRVYDQTWTINIKLEFPEDNDKFENCGGYIP